MFSLTTLTTPLSCLAYNDNNTYITFFSVIFTFKSTTQSLTQYQVQAPSSAAESTRLSQLRDQKLCTKYSKSNDSSHVRLTGYSDSVT